jgi:hypothetical protein
LRPVFEQFGVVAVRRGRDMVRFNNQPAASIADADTDRNPLSPTVRR